MPGRMWTDGPKDLRGKGYSESSLDFGYKIMPKLQLSSFYLFSSHSGPAEYYHAADINAAGVAKYGKTGVGNFQVHPLEPLSARLTLTAGF